MAREPLAAQTCDRRGFLATPWRQRNNTLKERDSPSVSFEVITTQIMTARRIYSPEYYQRMLEVEGQQYWWSRGMTEIAESILDKYITRASDNLILDAGCGTGLFMDSLKRYSRREVIGVDISPDAIALSRRRSDSTVLQASAAELPFSDNSFDLITCNDVLHHVYSRSSGVLKEFYRTLKADGFLYLRCSAKHRFRLNEDPGMDFHRYRIDELVEKALDVGFETCLASYVNLLPSVAGELKNLAMPSRPDGPGNGAARGLAFEVPPRVINDLLFRYLKLEAFLVARSWSIPAGHTIVTLFQKPDREQP